MKKLIAVATAVALSSSIQANTWTDTQIEAAQTRYSWNVYFSLVDNGYSLTDAENYRQTILGLTFTGEFLERFMDHNYDPESSRRKVKLNERTVTAVEGTDQWTRFRNYRNIAGTKTVTLQGCDVNSLVCNELTQVTKHRTRNGQYQQADFLITRTIDNPNYRTEEQQTAEYSERFHNEFSTLQETHQWQRNLYSDAQHRVQAAANIAHEDGYTGYGVRVGVIDGHHGVNSHGYNVVSGITQLAPDVIIKRAQDRGRRSGAELSGSDIVNLSQGIYAGKALPGSGAAGLVAPMFRGVPGDALVTVAAGNTGRQCNQRRHCNTYADYAMRNYTTIVVGLEDTDGDIHDQSDRAGALRYSYLIAPSVSYSTYELDPSTGLSDYTVRNNGTSFAAPTVAGAAALVMDKFDTDARETKQLLLRTADDLGAPGVDRKYGHGRLNLARALSPFGELQ